ncbi:hypothetical protein, partial [Escherichia coli]|uniref:hypothetical protein n=1 Tax=Escherichia coli TaxID=562 RepID=UPI00228294C1
MDSDPAGLLEQAGDFVQTRYSSVGAIVRQGLAAGASVDPDAAEADVARGGVVQMRTGADMHDLVGRDAQAVV